jgi:hypothetical protein
MAMGDVYAVLQHCMTTSKAELQWRRQLHFWRLRLQHY